MLRKKRSCAVVGISSGSCKSAGDIPRLANHLQFNIGIQYVATAKEWSCEDPSDIISLDYVVVEIADGSEASFGSLRAVEYKLKSLAISK